MLVVVEDMARRTRCSPIFSWPCRAHQKRRIRDARAHSVAVLAGGARAFGDGAARGTASSGVRYSSRASANIVLVVAPEAMSTGREAQVTLQAWGVCSSTDLVNIAGWREALPRVPRSAVVRACRLPSWFEWSPCRLPRRVQRRTSRPRSPC